MSTLIRHAATLLLVAALVLLGFAGAAQAQDTYSPVLPEVGPISNVPANLSGEAGSVTGITENALAFAAPSLTPAAGADGVGGTGGGNGALAFTGADSATLAAGGMSLLLVGGAAVVASRKR